MAFPQRKARRLFLGLPDVRPGPSAARQCGTPFSPTSRAADGPAEAVLYLRSLLPEPNAWKYTFANLLFGFNQGPDLCHQVNQVRYK
jgi:hypothetical protein